MDRLQLEQQMADFGAALHAQQFDSLADLAGLLQEFVGSDLGHQSIPAQTPVAKAQALMQEAWQASEPDHRIALARQALETSPSCPDAYVLLAQESTTDPFRALSLYQQAEAEGRKLLGDDCFYAEMGRFWQTPETRPYMRARRGLADTLWLLGNKRAAIQHYRALLALNPADNQDVRYKLLACLLDVADPSVTDLLAQYPEDPYAAWLYPQALWRFRREGATQQANQELAAALTQNDYVPAYLLGQSRLPATLPDYHGWGDEAEAMLYAAQSRYLWQRTPGALAWLNAYRSRPV
jgi:tetratricopeptide (TPR) repeat protein